MANCKHGGRVNHCFEEMGVSCEAREVPSAPCSSWASGECWLRVSYKGKGEREGEGEGGGGTFKWRPYEAA
jgi:hypothetical protein